MTPHVAVIANGSVWWWACYTCPATGTPKNTWRQAALGAANHRSMRHPSVACPTCGASVSPKRLPREEGK